MVNYLIHLDGYDDYSNDSKSEFHYLPVGGLQIGLSNGLSYCIADYNTTRLQTSGVGIRIIQDDQRDLTKEPVSEFIQQQWSNLIGQKIIEINLFVQNEEWTNYRHNEDYTESLELRFNNNMSVFYFCGDIEEYSKSEQRYLLLGGQNSGIIFFDRTTFSKYGLDNVKKIAGYNNG